MRSLMNVVIVGSMLQGCASIPKAQIQYYLPRSRLVVTVTQTADCDASKTHVVAGTSAAMAVTYTSDVARLQRFDMKGQDGSFADTEGTFTFTEDGRLKGINSSSTGQGEAIIKSAVSLAETALALGVAAGGKPAPSAECSAIATWGGGKPVTLTYTAVVEDPSKLSPTAIQVTVDGGSRDLYLKLKGALPALAVELAEVKQLEPMGYAATNSRDLMLTLSKVTKSTVRVTADNQEVARQTLVVPSTGAEDTYMLPIAKPALFGKSTFVLSLSDAGAITSLAYTKTNGGSAAIDSANAVATAAKPQSASDHAAELQAEVNEIVQQQKLTKCRADPATCGQ